MNTKLLFTTCIFILTFTCCKKAQNDEGYSGVKTITYGDTQGALKDTTFFKSKVIIPLETNNLALIGEISRIFTADDTLFVLDTNFQSIIIFNKNGEYINSIQNIGGGPKEYIDLADICVDNKNKELIVLCTRPSKLQFYSYQGQFLREHDLGDNYYSNLGTDGKFIYLHDNSNINQGRAISIYDRQLNHMENTLNHGKNYKTNEYGTVNHFGKGKNMTQDSSIHIVREFDNIIYEAKDSKVYPKYRLNFEEHSLPKDLLNKQMQPFEFLDLCSEKQYIISVKDVVENPSHLLFSTNIGIFVCDKQKGEMKRYSFILDTESGTGKGDYQVVGNSNQIAIVWSVSLLKKILENSLSNLDETNCKKEFLKKLKAMDDEANPILFIYDF